jgi:two-component system cell cycle sensor histidine kinase/response regulator CckA
MVLESKRKRQVGERAMPGLPARRENAATVLLVDDEEAIRSVVRAILEEGGYAVLAAANGREALSLCEPGAGPIDLLLTDLDMPVIGGGQLAEDVRKVRPDLKVIFMSGAAHEDVIRLRFESEAPFLQKPFTSAELMRKVRETLDSRVGIDAPPTRHDSLI